MIDLSEFEFQEPVTAARALAEKEPYLYVRNSGVIQFNTAVQRKHEFIPGNKVAFYSKKEDDKLTLLMVKNATSGHLLRGNAEKVNCQVSDSTFAGKILLAVAAVKGISVSKIKKVELPVIDLNDKSGNIFKLDIDRCSVDLIEEK